MENVDLADILSSFFIRHTDPYSHQFGQEAHRVSYISVNLFLIASIYFMSSELCGSRSQWTMLSVPYSYVVKQR